MDIVQVLGVSISATLEENKLEINAALSDPSREGALVRLEKAVRNYALAKTQLDILTSLKKQVEDMEAAPQEQDVEN